MTSTVAFLLATVAFIPIQARARGDTRLLLRGSGHQGHVGSLLVSDDGSETCAELMNKGSYFATKVGIGTPMKGTAAQEFELVADTGSDSVIVTSCVCVKNQMCGETDKCYQGNNHSSSFVLTQSVVNKSTNQTAPLGVDMTFGSGTVMSIIATDVVKFAGQQATMNDGLLLMVDRRMLQIEGSFEGILGLGPPGMKGHSADKSADAKQVALNDQYSSKLFVQKAGVERYSLCFNDGGTPGAMRLNVPEFKKPLPTIGTMHWGLGLYGVSVGDEKTEAFVCGTGDMKDGQKTPCGAIPDSGTTLLMGPKDHVIKLFATLCDNWDRCKKAREDGDLKDETKQDAFQKLLFRCGEWRTDEKGIDEVPSIFFNVGEPGNQQKLELSAWSYIVETEEEQYNHSTKYLFGTVPVDVPKSTGKKKQVCMPNLGVQEYNTKDNGPVWIMGHPLFYQFQVGFDLGKGKLNKGKDAKMEMAFTREKCGSCSDKTSFLSENVKVNQALPKRARPTRVVNVPPIVPHRDLSLPL